MNLAQVPSWTIATAALLTPFFCPFRHCPFRTMPMPTTLARPSIYPLRHHYGDLTDENSRPGSIDDNGFRVHNNRKDKTVYLKEMEDLLHDAFLQTVKLTDPTLPHDEIQQTHDDLWQAYGMWGKLLYDCGIRPKTPRRPEPQRYPDVCEGRRSGINKLPWRPSTTPHYGHEPTHQPVNNRPPLQRPKLINVIKRMPKLKTSSAASSPGHTKE